MGKKDKYEPRNKNRTKYVLFAVLTLIVFPLETVPGITRVRWKPFLNCINPSIPTSSGGDF